MFLENWHNRGTQWRMNNFFNNLLSVFINKITVERKEYGRKSGLIKIGSRFDFFELIEYSKLEILPSLDLKTSSGSCNIVGKLFWYWRCT